MRRVFRIARKMLVLWLALTLIPLLYYWYLSNKTQDEQLQQLQIQGLQFLSYVDERAARIYSEIDKTLYEIGHSSLLYDFALHEQTNLQHYLEKQWFITSLNSSRFDQLRYLNNDGQEVIRVDFPHTAKSPYIVPRDQLQNKAHRDYFQYALRLRSDQTGHVGLDLEYEFGKVVLPYKPGFRVIYPIEGEARMGYFIANLDVLQVVQEITQNSQGLPVSFIDQSGYYILSSDTSRLFGHLIESRRQFAIPTEQPELWQAIQDSQKPFGSINTTDGLYIFRHIQTPLFAQIDGLTLITLYPASLLASNVENQLAIARPELVIVWLVLGLLSMTLAAMLEFYQSKQLNQAFSDLMVENSNAILLTDSHFNLIRANTRFLELTHFNHHQLLGKRLRHFLREQSKWQQIKQQLQEKGDWKGVLELFNQQMEVVACETEIRPLNRTLNKTKGQTTSDYYVLSFTDISEHHNRIAQLKDLTERDPATLLWNKRKFESLLIKHCRLLTRYPDHPVSCLAIIDIDNFKQVNDSKGHNYGDQVIMYLAAKLKQSVRETDEIARIGGDEFAVLLHHTTAEQANQLMSRISNAIDHSAEFTLTISVGVAQMETDWQASFNNADSALYQAKHCGRNCVISHSASNVTPIGNSSA